MNSGLKNKSGASASVFLYTSRGDFVKLPEYFDRESSSVSDIINYSGSSWSSGKDNTDYK